jgi:CRP-like cAMP-binding protein
MGFKEDELVLLARQQSKFFYLLLSGSVSIEVGTRSYTLGIQVLGPGEAFGWSALLDHHDTLFQVRAREQSKALCLDGSQLSAALRDDPVLAAELLRRTLKLVAAVCKRPKQTSANSVAYACVKTPDKTFGLLGRTRTSEESLTGDRTLLADRGSTGDDSAAA